MAVKPALAANSISLGSGTAASWPRIVEVLRERTKLAFCGAGAAWARPRLAVPTVMETAAAVPAARFRTPRRETFLEEGADRCAMAAEYTAGGRTAANWRRHPVRHAREALTPALSRSTGRGRKSGRPRSR